MEILTSVKRLYISFKSPVNDFVYSFGRAALLLLVEVQNHTVPVRERGRIRVNDTKVFGGMDWFLLAQDSFSIGSPQRETILYKPSDYQLLRKICCKQLFITTYILALTKYTVTK